MKIVTNPSEMKNLSTTYRKAGKTVGLVPTMGALHDGHAALMAEARRLCDVVVTSIFVNPIQFGPAEDFSKYPRPFDRDCRKAEESGCDVVFAPAAGAIYPADFSTFVDVEKITDTLCGARRPGHFKGVATVVLKFFNIISPHVAVFGQKDAQQCLVIRRMVRDLDCPVRLVFVPTVREQDGLAISSRNMYLSPEERRATPLIYKGLSAAALLYESGERSAAKLKEAIAQTIRGSALLAVEYIEIVDMETLAPVPQLSAPVLAAVAARTAETGTRLIDNVVLGGTF
ncbi:MAG TPA: pantoate--beta-alanine ligase [Chitinivibrionales bacterium]|jgi:pantoate--beta-alanine ligase|nr:pantoate--beta-alanine ligase [Chitinivibrionales bacterium]